MVKRGRSPFLECSTRGDKRFSPFFARIKRYGKTIEDIYQGAKVFPDGSTGLGWKEAKGRKCTNLDEVRELYDLLWEEYLEENPHLKDILVNVTGVSDRFGKEGETCQAETLWRLRDKLKDTV